MVFDTATRVVVRRRADTTEVEERLGETQLVCLSPAVAGEGWTLTSTPRRVIWSLKSRKDRIPDCEGTWAWLRSPGAAGLLERRRWLPPAQAEAMLGWAT
jgi:hypothetical protein